MTRILLVGATGYIGGTVLTQLLSNTVASLHHLEFDLFVRSENSAQKLRDAYGDRVNPILWTGLDDTTFIENTATNYDIIINAGCGFIPAGAKAFIDGLARRIRFGHAVPWYIHTSGCTNLVHPDTIRAPREWDDGEDGQAIFEYMERLDAKELYAQRTTELLALNTAAETGVQAVSLQIPVIFGEGTGLFNRQGLVIPEVMRYVVKHGYGCKLNDAANFDWVHILDLADYYILLLRTMLEGPGRGKDALPTGRSGVFFPAVGRTLISDIFQKALDVAFTKGVLPRPDTPQTKEVRLLPLLQVADELAAGSCEIAKRGWGGTKAVRASIGPKLLGWKPSRLQEAWDKDFEDELAALMGGRRGETFANCVGIAAKT